MSVDNLLHGIPQDVDQRVAAVAATGNLGQRIAVYRNRRPVWRKYPLRVMVTAIMASVPVCGWGLHSPYLAAALLVVTLFGVLAFGYFGEPVLGRQWIVLYDNGFVHANRHLSRAVPWTSVLDVHNRPPGGEGTAVITTWPEAYQIRWGDGIRLGEGRDDHEIIVAHFDRQGELVAALDRQLLPRLGPIVLGLRDQDKGRIKRMRMTPAEVHAGTRRNELLAVVGVVVALVAIFAAVAFALYIDAVTAVDY